MNYIIISEHHIHFIEHVLIRKSSEVSLFDFYKFLIYYTLGQNKGHIFLYVSIRTFRR